MATTLSITHYWYDIDQTKICEWYRWRYMDLMYWIVMNWSRVTSFKRPFHKNSVWILGRSIIKKIQFSIFSFIYQIEENLQQCVVCILCEYEISEHITECSCVIFSGGFVITQFFQCVINVLSSFQKMIWTFITEEWFLKKKKTQQPLPNFRSNGNSKSL